MWTACRKGRERERESKGKGRREQNVCIISLCGRKRKGGKVWWKECQPDIHSGEGGRGRVVFPDRERDNSNPSFWFPSPKRDEERERKRRQTIDALNVSHYTERKKE